MMEEDASFYKKNANFFSQKIILETVTWSHAPYSSCIRAASPWPLSRHSQSTRRECSEKGCVLPQIILWVVNALFNTPWIKNLVLSLWPYWGLASSVGEAKWKEIGWWGISLKGRLRPFFLPLPSTRGTKQVSPTRHVPITTHHAADRSAQAQNETRNQINLSSCEGDHLWHFITAKECWPCTSWGHAHHSFSLPWVSAPVWAPMPQRRAVAWCSEREQQLRKGSGGIGETTKRRVEWWRVRPVSQLPEWKKKKPKKKTLRSSPYVPMILPRGGNTGGRLKMGLCPGYMPLSRLHDLFRMDTQLP